MKKVFLPFIIFVLLGAFLSAQAPSGLIATPFSTTAHLSWDNYTAFEALGFNIYRSMTSSSYGAPVRQVGAYSDYTDYNLTANTTYYYKIAAFDELGNESALSQELVVTTNQNDYLKVASLDLLIPIYNGGMSANAPSEIMQGLEFARGVFYRNTFGQLNLKFHFMEIEGYPPVRTDGLADFNTIGADLTARGILDNQYDAIHIESLKLYGWFGGALWLGQTAGSMGYNWTGFDPENHYSRGDAWLFTHEFGHSLDLIIANRSGFPEMVFNHFAHAHPMIPEIGVFDAGENFDGMALVLRLFEHHLEYQAPWDGYIEVLDNDGDGFADDDARLVNDEARFGSNPALIDTDGDGLNDKDEFTVAVYSGTDPNNTDSDGDGALDGVDVYPGEDIPDVNIKTDQPVVVDGVLDNSEEWQSMGTGTFYTKLPGAVLHTYCTWDDDYLYFAFQSDEYLKYHLMIDGNGEDGIFASDKRWVQGDYSNFDATSYGISYFEEASLLVRADDSQVYTKGNPVAGSQIETVFDFGIYTTEIKIPHNIGPGFGFNYQDPSSPVISELVFNEGDIIGMQLIAHPLLASNAYVWNDWRTANWMSLGPPFHYFDMTLTGSNPVVCTGDYILSSQAEVNAFDCTTITGNLYIGDASDTDISDLSPLALLTSVGGFLVIENNLGLSDLNGLDALTSIGSWFFVENNNGLTNLNGFSSLQSVGGSMNIHNNDLLSDISALSNLSTVGLTFSINNNSDLTDVGGLGSLTSVEGTVIISNNVTLQEITGFSSLISTGLGLWIENNSVLSNISGFDQLNSIGADDLSIRFNPALTSFEPFPMLQHINASVRVEENFSLANLNGLSTIETIGNNLWLFGNPALSDCCGIYDLLNSNGIGGTINIFNNPNFCNSESEIIANCGAPPTYCASSSIFPWHDWIAKVKIADINHSSSKSVYSDFTDISTLLGTGNTPIELTTGFSYTTWDEYWRVWIDLNQDGDFEDANEMVFSGILSAPPNGTSQSILSGNLSIPDNAINGITRLRVSMNRGAFPSPCENFQNGEVEDYTVDISGTSLPAADLELTASASPTSIYFGNVDYVLTLTNQGPNAADGVEVRHYQNEYFASYQNINVPIGTIFDSGTMIWLVPSLSAGESVTLTFEGQIENLIVPQIDFFEIIAVQNVDPDSSVDNDNGNFTADEDDEAAIQLYPANPADLTLSQFEITTNPVDPGEALVFPYTILNQGGLAAGIDGNIPFDWFVSTDDQWSSDDIAVGGGALLIPLAPGEEYASVGSTFAPNNIPSGDYFLIFRLDPEDIIYESDESNNIFVEPFFLTSGGNGSYCNSISLFPWHDWIAGVQVGDLNNSSGKSKYSDFTNLTAHLETGNNYPIALTTGFSYFTWDEHWRIWIDFNQDYDFTDPGEMVFSDILAAPPNGTPSGLLNGNISIPASAMQGVTRMRVSMKRGEFPTPCESIPFGEVEDYSVEISATASLANLRIPQVEVIPSNICFTTPGEPVGYIGGLVLNDGDADAGPFEIKVTLSKDHVPSADDVHWLDLSYPGLAVNGTAGINLGSEPTPASLPVGRYYILFHTDSEDVVPESNEDDNLHSSGIQFGAPDYVLNAVTGIPSSSSGGSSFNIIAEVMNQVAFPLPELFGAVDVVAYLSSDDVFNTSGDTEIGMSSIAYDQFSNGPLYEGGIASTAIGVQIPNNIPEADYFIFVLVDEFCDDPSNNNVSDPNPIRIETSTPGDYCMPISDFPWHEWISRVELNTIDHSSGKSRYSDFTNISTSLVPGNNYAISLTAGFSWATWDEYWSVWIDFNQDGDFADANELVFWDVMAAPPNGTPNASTSDSFTVPNTALPGVTRMRVIMKRDGFPEPCNDIPFGEIEDYTIVIANSLTDNSGSDEMLFEATQDNTRVNVFGITKLQEAVIQIEIERSMDGSAFENLASVSGHAQSGAVQGVQAVDEKPSEGINYYRMRLMLENGAEVISPVRAVNFEILPQFTIFPNPASDALYIQMIAAPEMEMLWTIQDNTGRVLWSKKLISEKNQIEAIDISELEAGMYYLFVKRQNKRAIGKRFVIVR